LAGWEYWETYSGPKVKGEIALAVLKPFAYSIKDVHRTVSDTWVAPRARSGPRMWRRLHSNPDYS
jgi:hypothetical protein